jgi:hypothetical protein
MKYHLKRGSEILDTFESHRDEPLYLERVKEPNALGQAPYDPLIDIAYEQMLGTYHANSEFKRMAEKRVEEAGGMEHIKAMRSRIRL